VAFALRYRRAGPETSGEHGITVWRTFVPAFVLSTTGIFLVDNRVNDLMTEQAFSFSWLPALLSIPIHTLTTLMATEDTFFVKTKVFKALKEAKRLDTKMPEQELLRITPYFIAFRRRYEAFMSTQLAMGVLSLLFGLQAVLNFTPHLKDPDRNLLPAEILPALPLTLVLILQQVYVVAKHNTGLDELAANFQSKSAGDILASDRFKIKVFGTALSMTKFKALAITGIVWIGQRMV